MIFLAFIIPFLHSYTDYDNVIDQILVLELQRRLYYHDQIMVNQLSYFLQQRINTLPHIPNFTQGFTLQSYVQHLCLRKTSHQIQKLIMFHSQQYFQYYNTYYQFHSVVAATNNIKNGISQ